MISHQPYLFLYSSTNFILHCVSIHRRQVVDIIMFSRISICVAFYIHKLPQR